MKAYNIGDSTPDEVRDGVKLAQDIQTRVEGHSSLEFNVVRYDGEDNTVKVKQTNGNAETVNAFFRFVFEHDGEVTKSSTDRGYNSITRWAEFEP